MTKPASDNRHAPPAPDDAVTVGTIVAASGLRGELKVAPLTDFPRRFSPGSTLYLEGRAARVVSSRQHKRGVVVKLDLVNDRNHAESLRSTPLTIPADDLESLPDGSYYHFQIIGIEVWSEDGERLGEVAEIIDTGVNDVYLVRSEGSKDLLVPSIESVVLEADIPANRMTVRLPEGLR